MPNAVWDGRNEWRNVDGDETLTRKHIALRREAH